MKTIEFSETESRIDINEYFDLVQDLKRNLVVGLECERAVNLNSQILARHLQTSFVPYGQSRRDSSLAGFKKATSNEFNVAFVTSDASVTYGNEILFCGTNEKFGWIHEKLFKLESKLDKFGCLNYDNTTSNHITLLTLQDKLLNPIIVKNLYNLTRVFSPALYWLCSGDPNNIVRTRVNSYSTFSNLNPKERTFQSLKDSNARTSIINLSKQDVLSVGGHEKLSGLLVEFRNTDGFRVPCAITSLMMMYKAMTFKAIELSTKGLISVESLCDWEKIKALCTKITSTSRELDVNDINKCQEQANELIDLLLPQLKSISPEAIPILRELAIKPISKRSGNWTKIEKSLIKKINNKLSDNEETLVNVIISGEFREDSAGKWKSKVAQRLGVTERMIEYMIKKIEGKTNQKILFDYEIQSYIFQ